MRRPGKFADRRLPFRGRGCRGSTRPRSAAPRPPRRRVLIAPWSCRPRASTRPGRIPASGSASARG